MSDNMFLGRKFTIPYENTTDRQVSSMARAQMVTGTASPGTVVQVGDKVYAYGVSAQEAKMGDLDSRLRSIDQLSAPAQEAVRRNIAWQYGDQSGEVKKSWVNRLLGRTHLMDHQASQALFPAPKERAGELAPPELFAASPRPGAPKAPPTPKAPPVPKKPKASAMDVAEAKIASKKAPAASPAQAPEAKVPVSAGNPKPGQASEGRMPVSVDTHLGLAFDTFHRRHRAARSEGWDMGRERVRGHLHTPAMMSSIATHQATGHVERHDFSWDADSNSVVHSYLAPGSKAPVQSAVIPVGDPHIVGKDGKKKPNKDWDPKELYDHVLRSHDSWDS